MNFIRSGALFLTLFILASLPTRADDLPAGTFSNRCSYSSETSNGGVMSIRKVYINGNKMRIESQVNDVQSIMIIDGDQQVSYILLPAQKIAVTMPMNALMAKSALSPSHPSGTTTKVGADNVNGVDCTKYSVVTPQGKTFFLWYDSSDHLVEIASDDNSSTTTFMNYQEGAQQDSLFQPPGSYKQVAAPKRVPRPSNLPPLPQVSD